MWKSYPMPAIYTKYGMLLCLNVIAFIKYQANCRPLFIVNNWGAFCLDAYQNIHIAEYFEKWV